MKFYTLCNDMKWFFFRERTYILEITYIIGIKIVKDKKMFGSFITNLQLAMNKKAKKKKSVVLSFTFYNYKGYHKF